MRLVCLGYLIYLTALLMVADPSKLIGVHENMPEFLRVLEPAAHLLSFFVLAVLGLMTRWPAPRWGIALILVLYAGLTEIAQGFVPRRTPEWKDWFQDVAGIAIGAIVCWGVAVAASACTKFRRRSEQCAAADASDEWNVVRSVMSRRTAQSQWWWG